jgi:hypothetical protein
LDNIEHKQQRDSTTAFGTFKDTSKHRRFFQWIFFKDSAFVSSTQEKERQELRLETLNRIKHKIGIRLMRYAQPEIIGICLAMSSFDLPPYVLLWIIDWLPNYDRLSHHKKIQLIESVRVSIWKINGKRRKKRKTIL